MNPAVLKNGIWALFKADTPSGLYNTLTGGLHRGTGKVSPIASMPFGVFDLLGFGRNDAMGSLYSAQFQEGTVQFTFWSNSASDTEIENIEGLASALYDYCGMDRQNTISVTGWTVTFFRPGTVMHPVDPAHADKYQLVMDYFVMLQKND